MAAEVQAARTAFSEAEPPLGLIQAVVRRAHRATVAVAAAEIPDLETSPHLAPLL